MRRNQGDSNDSSHCWFILPAVTMHEVKLCNEETELEF